MNLLDERIDCRQSVDRETWVETRADFIAMAQYKGIADTIVQLIRWSAEGVISSARATRSEERRLEGGLSPSARPCIWNGRRYPACRVQLRSDQLV